MTTRDRLTLAAALAVVLAGSALRPRLRGPRLAAARRSARVVAVSGAAALARLAAAPRALQPARRPARRCSPTPR